MTKYPPMRPACFASALTYTAIASEECLSCPFEAECRPIARERLAMFEIECAPIFEAKRQIHLAKGRVRKRRHDAKKHVAPAALDVPVSEASLHRRDGFDRLVASPPTEAASFLRQVAHRGDELVQAWEVIQGLGTALRRKPRNPEIRDGLAGLGRELSDRSIRGIRDILEKLETLGWAEPERGADLVTALA